MAETPQKRRFALDTNVSLDLAAGRDAALTLVEVCQERKYGLCLSPTVIQELAHLAADFEQPANSLAVKALTGMRSWGVIPFELNPVGNGITEAFARKLIDSGLLPEGEIHDGQIVAEAALGGIPVLITSDTHLLAIEPEVMTNALSESGLSNVLVTSPRKILRTLSPKEGKGRR